MEKGVKEISEDHLSVETPKESQRPMNLRVLGEVARKPGALLATEWTRARRDQMKGLDALVLMTSRITTGRGILLLFSSSLSPEEEEEALLARRACIKIPRCLGSEKEL